MKIVPLIVLALAAMLAACGKEPRHIDYGLANEISYYLSDKVAVPPGSESQIVVPTIKILTLHAGWYTEAWNSMETLIGKADSWIILQSVPTTTRIVIRLVYHDPASGTWRTQKWLENRDMPIDLTGTLVNSQQALDVFAALEKRDQLDETRSGPRNSVDYITVYRDGAVFHQAIVNGDSSEPDAAEPTKKLALFVQKVGALATPQ